MEHQFCAEPLCVKHTEHRAGVSFTVKQMARLIARTATAYMLSETKGRICGILRLRTATEKRRTLSR
jgi:hypothetical protein